MKKIKDRIVLGAVTGTVVSIPMQLLDVYLNKHGMTDVAYGPTAAKLFLKKKQTRTLGGRVVSAAVNAVNTGAVGTSIVYMLSLSGKDKAVIKGAGIGALMWVGVAGFLSNKGLNVVSKKPATPLFSLALHLLFGGMSAYTITKLGDESLFPDKRVQDREKVPVLYTGANQKPPMQPEHSEQLPVIH
jgi:hypothetical protein